MEDVPELWGWRIWVVSEQVQYAVISLWHMLFLSPPRVFLPHFPLTQSEFSLHSLQASTPSSRKFGGFIICYILVVLENGDCYRCWNQCWKDACLPACLPVGHGTRQRRTVGCKMEVMVSLSFSSKYYQLVHINKFLLNEHHLPCLSFPASLMYLFTYCSRLRLCFPLSPLLPMCLWHQDTASLSPHLQHSSCSSTSPGKLWMHHTHIQQPWQRLSAWPGLSLSCRVPDATSMCQQPPWVGSGALALVWCSVAVLHSWSQPLLGGCCLSRSQVHVVIFGQSSKKQISYVKTLTKPSLNSYKTLK